MTELAQTPLSQAGDSLVTVLFGQSAQVVAAGSEQINNVVSLTDNIVIKIGVWVLFVAYLLVLTLYGGHLGDMTKIILGRNLGIKVANELSYLFVKAMRTSVLMGILTWSLITIKGCETIGVDVADKIKVEWLLPICIVVAVLLFALMWAITHWVCWLVRRKDLGEGLEMLSEATMAIAAVVSTPIALILVMSNGGLSTSLLITAIVLACVALFTYAIKSFIFFLEQKISILLWLLYLCTAVLIPLGIIVSTVLHNSTP